jgi:glycine cleavage system H protein
MSEKKFSKNHAWLETEGNIAKIGITDFAQKQLKDIVFVDLPEKDKEIQKDSNLANIESVKSVSEVKAPISGKVIEINSALLDSPEMINSDCYKEGWLVKLEIKDNSELDSLISEEDYKKENSA